MPVSIEWLRAEAEYLGIMLTDEDLSAICEELNKTRAALAASRQTETEGLEPPYRFFLPQSTPDSTTPEHDE